MNAITPRIPTVDNLLARQATGTTAFLAWVAECKARYIALDLPCGSPAQHFDPENITGFFDDLLVLNDPAIIEWMARDIVAEDEFMADQTRNDSRRALAGE
jgi:hypothetical protein